MSQALWHINASKSELRKVEKTEDASLVCIQSLCSLISIGTERTVCKGNIDRLLEANMAVPYMEGSFDLPLKYGYSVIGESPSGSSQRFHFMHPHQSHCWVEKESLTQIPEAIPSPRACLISNMETVINAIWDADIQGGEKVLILGFGAIGSLLSMSLQKRGDVELYICDIDAWRIEKGEELGFQIWQGEKDFDIVFHLSASGSGLQKAINLCKHEGKVIEMSWYGNNPITLNLGASFHYGRKSIISSQVSSIPGKMAGSWDYAKRKELAISYLMDDSYDKLISHIIPFSQSPDLFEDIRYGKLEPGLNWVLSYKEKF